MRRPTAAGAVDLVYLLVAVLLVLLIVWLFLDLLTTRR